MEKRLTDEEIIKALQYCTNCVCNNDKDECPLLKMSFCRNYLMKQSLDLINRLQAENKKNENIIRLADKTIETANAEIERLKQNLEEVHIDIREHLAENERLKTEKDNLIKTYAECQVANLKEFVKRLETLKQFRSCVLGSDYELSVTMREIDKTYKEMVGDKE